ASSLAPPGMTAFPVPGGRCISREFDEKLAAEAAPTRASGPGISGPDAQTPSPHQRGILEPPDLVAHAGGFLELQVAGVLVHLLLQRLELRHGLGRVERGVVLALLRHAA